jgi:hypothetical protein
MKRLPRTIVAAVDESHYVRIKAGPPSGHRFIGIWAVVVNGRVFARSWTLKPDGWYRAFLEDPRGSLQVGARVVRIRAIPARAASIRDAVERAYAEKYTTPASKRYVRGFRTARRREATMEFGAR